VILQLNIHSPISLFSYQIIPITNVLIANWIHEWDKPPKFKYTNFHHHQQQQHHCYHNRYAHSQNCEIRLLASWRLSVRPQWTTRLQLGVFLWNITVLLNNRSRNFNINFSLTKVSDTLHEEKYTFLVIPHSVLLWMWNVFNKVVEKIKKIYFMFKHFLFFIVLFIR
jgi:hypothetical protein